MSSPCHSTVTQLWTIENFSYHYNVVLGNAVEHHCLKSAKFPSSPPSNEPQFSIQLYPNGTSKKENSKYMAIYLSLESFNFAKHTNLNIKCRISLYGKDWFRYRSEEKEYQFWKLTSFGWPEFIYHEVFLNNYESFLPDDKLTLLCEVSYHCESMHRNIALATSQEDDNLYKLFQSGFLSDLVLSVSGIEFKVHKCVLGAMSPVFEVILQKRMLLQTEQEPLMIADFVQVSAFEHFLRYIYNEQICLTDSIASDLLTLSDKYCVDKLKSLCEEYLASRLCHQTVLDILVLANSCDSDYLKKHAIEYIKLHDEAIICSQEWKSVFENRPDLLKDVLNQLYT